MTMTMATPTTRRLRCPNVKNGRECGHIVVKLPDTLFKARVADEVEVECRRCGNVAPLKEWRDKIGT